MENEDSKIGKEENLTQDSVEDSEDNPTLEELENEISRRDNEIVKLHQRLDDAQGRIQDLVKDKKVLQTKINEFELIDLNLELSKYKELKIEHNKLKHRTQVTKQQLDEARERVKFLENVINSLENRGLKERILRRYPEVYLTFKKER